MDLGLRFGRSQELDQPGRCYSDSSVRIRVPSLALSEYRPQGAGGGRARGQNPELETADRNIVFIFSDFRFFQIY
jgi:hypothetical protein